MAKISINLLPVEFITEELKASKFYKIQTIGVAIILGMSFLVSLTVSLRILQSHNIVQVQTRLKDAEQKVTDLKSTQASLVLLKDRLKTINQYLGTASKQTSMYKLIDKLVPPSVLVNSVTIDGKGEVVLLALLPDSESLDNLISSLTTKESNEDLIKSVSIDSLNRGKDGAYRISLAIKPK